MRETKWSFRSEKVGMMNMLLGWTGFVMMMNERVTGGCLFSCGNTYGDEHAV